jgi:ABC-2 type transport system permease protein
MSILWVLLKKELWGFFISPVAYVVVAMVMILSSFSAKAALSILERGPSEGSLVTWTFHSTWFWLSYFFIFPLLTMRLFAEEKKMGTFETLFTAPVSTWQVIWAKYLAALILYLILWLPSYSSFLIIDWIALGQIEIPAGQVRGSYLIIFFMGLFNLALGCLASSLTANQIIAAIVSYTFSLLHYLIGFFISLVGRDITSSFIDITHYFSSAEHIRTFTNGLIDTRPMIYYTSMALLLMCFTHMVVDYRRWKS